MNVNRSFSHPVEWHCLDNLIAEYPPGVQRSITSKIIRDAVELFAKQKVSKQTNSLDDYEDSLVPNMKWDKKTWTRNVKTLDPKDLREWKILLTKRLALVDEELYRRTL
jgi:hypothetical protein